MIPLQDVVPTRRRPVATLVLIGVNVAFAVASAFGLRPAFSFLFTQHSLVMVAVGLLFLWLFGDNVEDRLGRLTLVAVYLIGGLVSGMGAAGGITAVMGSYFVLLPRSRVLVLVPVPEVLVEVPAVFFLGIWAALHVARFISQPWTLWSFAIALAIGGIVAYVMRRPVAWEVNELPCRND